MMTKHNVFLFFLLATSVLTYAQTQNSFIKHIKELCSPKMFGRGAEFSGDSIAAKYISSQYKSYGLKTAKGSYYQSFDYSVNTFEGAYELTINNKTLRPGTDFMVHPSSRPGKGNFKTFRITKENWEDEKFRAYFLKKHWVNKIIIYDHELNDTKTKDFFKLKLAKLQAAALIDVIPSDPIANESSYQLQPPTFQISKKKLASFGKIDRIEFNIDALVKKEYPTQNVIGIVEGKNDSTNYIIVSAHYDHIGHLGKETMLQGANDNASGVSMLLSLAEHFSKPENQPEKSILFIAFAAEEIGLLGSEHYTENPLVSLEKTSFVLNLDLMGSGSKGVTVVNGVELDIESQLLESINESGKYVKDIQRKKNRANSDHFHFTTKDVPAFFIYARGNVGGYHNLGDTVDKLEKNEFEGLFNLFKEFIISL